MRRSLILLSALSFLVAALAAYAAEESSWGQVKSQWNAPTAPLPAAKTITTPGGTTVFISEGEDWCIFGGGGTGWPSVTDGTGLMLPPSAYGEPLFDHITGTMRTVPDLSASPHKENSVDPLVFSYEDFRYVETAQGNFSITCRWDIREDTKCGIPPWIMNPPGVFECEQLGFDLKDLHDIMIPKKARNVIFDDPGQRFHLTVTPSGRVTSTSFVNPSTAPVP